MAAIIYIGTPAALQAEIGLLPCYKARYVVAAFRANGQEFTPELAETKADAQTFAREFKRHLASLGETSSIAWVA